MQTNDAIPMARPVAQSQAPAGAFSDEAYTIRRKVFKLFGAAFHLYDSTDRVVGYSKQKAFKLKEDIRIYTDESMQRELLTILARSVIDFAATYDVADPCAGGQVIGSLRRKGWTSSFLRDEWLIFSPDGQQIGMLQEQGGVLSFLRRWVDFVAFLSPQKFTVLVGQTPVAQFRQHFNPFVYRLSVAFVPNLSQHIDARLVLAAAILVAAIEGRQG